MAEDIHADMQRWLAYVQDFHIDEWADAQQRSLDHAEGLWRDVIQAQQYVEVGEVTRPHLENLERFLFSLERARGLRDGEDVAIPPDAHLHYYVWEAEQRASDADYWDPTDADQRAYEDAPYGRLEDEGHLDATEGQAGGEMGESLTAQLAALDATLDALLSQGQDEDLGHDMEMDY